MSDEPKTLSVKILDKEYRVSCPTGEESNLRESARYLDDKMREIRKTGKTVGVERIAIMAALNMAHELMQKNQELDRTTEYSKEQLNRLLKKIETALATQES